MADTVYHKGVLKIPYVSEEERERIVKMLEESNDISKIELPDNQEDMCRICGSKEIYCIQETNLVKHRWLIVHTAYCEKCAKDIELYELQKRIIGQMNKVAKQ